MTLATADLPVSTAAAPPTAAPPTAAPSTAALQATAPTAIGRDEEEDYEGKRTTSYPFRRSSNRASADGGRCPTWHVEWTGWRWPGPPGTGSSGRARCSGRLAGF